MKCAHCLVTFHDEPKQVYIDDDEEGHWAIVRSRCAACKKLLLFLGNSNQVRTNQYGHQVGIGKPIGLRQVRPRGTARPPVPPEVPHEIAEDYKEACLVLDDSPKASAALSRRCLQHLLRDTAKVKHGNLANEIDEVLKSNALPSHLADSVDAIRNIGNFSAHPLKSTASNQILAVEPHEAEWNLDVLEGLFDFYYVQPGVTAKRKAALDAKLASAGKPKTK